VKVVRGLFLCSSFCETAVNHLHVSSFLLINRRKRRDPGLMTDFLPFNESVIVSPGFFLFLFIRKRKREEGQAVRSNRQEGGPGALKAQPPSSVTNGLTINSLQEEEKGNHNPRSWPSLPWIMFFFFSGVNLMSREGNSLRPHGFKPWMSGPQLLAVTFITTHPSLLSSGALSARSALKAERKKR